MRGRFIGMKRTILLIQVMALLLCLTACGSSKNADHSETSDEAARMTAIQTETEISSDELITTTQQATQASPTSFTSADIEKAKDIVRKDSGHLLDGTLPLQFDSVNDIDMIYIIVLCHEQFGLQGQVLNDSWLKMLFGDSADYMWAEAFEPYEIEDCMKLNFNPDFSISSCDYSLYDKTPWGSLGIVWNRNMEKFVYYKGIWGGGTWVVTEVIDDYSGVSYDEYIIMAGGYIFDSYDWADKIDDFYYVRDNQSDFNIYYFGYIEYHFKKYPDGNVYLTAKKPI